MSGTRSLGVLGTLLALAACGTPSAKTVDFAKNGKLIGDLPFVTARPGDRAVFLAPVVDIRPARLAEREGGLPVVYGPDSAWDRPVPEMVGDLLARELAESQVFQAVLPTATPDAVVVVPQLASFHMGTVENVRGASTLAEFAVNLQVYGPVGSDGVRPLWFERLYGDRQITQAQLVPENMFFVASGAVARSVNKLLVSLDGTNVGRTGVPLQLGTATEASAAPR
jgi:hypothetical protein